MTGLVIRPQWGLPKARPSNTRPQAVVPTRTTAERAEGFANYQFSFLNLAASQTNLQATRNIGGTNSTIGVPMPYPGSIVGISFASNAAKTAGTATFVPFVAGVAQTSVLTWTESNTTDVQTFPAGSMPFLRGDVLDVRATTTSTFTPTTADIDVLCYVSFS